MNIWNETACDAVCTPAICANGRNSKRAQTNSHKTDFNEVLLSSIIGIKGNATGFGEILSHLGDQ
jgi:hypothetical protein